MWAVSIEHKSKIGLAFFVFLKSFVLCLKRQRTAQWAKKKCERCGSFFNKFNQHWTDYYGLSIGNLIQLMIKQFTQCITHYAKWKNTQNPDTFLNGICYDSMINYFHSCASIDMKKKIADVEASISFFVFIIIQSLFGLCSEVKRTRNYVLIIKIGKANKRNQ